MPPPGPQDWLGWHSQVSWVASLWVPTRQRLRYLVSCALSAVGTGDFSRQFASALSQGKRATSPSPRGLGEQGSPRPRSRGWPAGPHLGCHFGLDSIYGFMLAFIAHKTELSVEYLKKQVLH